MAKQFLGGVVALLLGVMPGAYAQGLSSSFQSGTALIEECLSDSPELQGRCIGYIAGVAGALGDERIGDARVCIPDGRRVSNDQLRVLVLAWLRGHSEERHLPAAGLIAEALSEVFVCQ